MLGVRQRNVEQKPLGIGALHYLLRAGGGWSGGTGQPLFIPRPVVNPFAALGISVIAFLYFSSTCSQKMGWQELLIQFQNDPDIVWCLGSPREAKRKDRLCSGEFPRIDLS